MFFTASKIFWLLAAPLNALLLITAFALILRFWKKQLANRILITTAWIFVILGGLPIGYNLMVFLERQYSVPKEMPNRVDGIIVLGGAFNSYLSEKTGQVAVNSNISRMITFMELSKQYPNAKKVFSGGSGNILRPDRVESDDAKEFLGGMGFKSDDFIYEPLSKNTYENAAFSRELLKPKEGETWIVVTSAFHMPRTVSVFEQLDWNIVPYPTGVKTTGKYKLFDPTINVVGNYFMLTKSLKEMIGVGVYYLTGKSSLFFPHAPINSPASDKKSQKGE